MTDLRTIVACAVAVALLLCVGGIIYLAAVPDRPVPDVLVALSTGALGYLGGLFAPTPQRRRGQGGYTSQGAGVLGVGLVTVVVGALLHLGLVVALGIAACVAGLVLLGMRR